MTEGEKARYLAGVMNDSAGTLKANGVSKHMEEMLAGVMMNEGGTNTRRIAMNKYMNNVMSGGKTGGVMGALDKAGGIDKLKADPAALEKLQKGMSEDQRFLLNRAMSGDIDVAGLKSDDKERARAARNQVTESGIDLRTQQYDEMTSLQARQKNGEKLSKEEQARLTQISNIGGSAMGFDSLDRRKGVDAKMADTRGLSSGRFREIYEDTQQRFEPVHYRQWRDGYEKQTADNAKLPADKQKPVKLKSGIGDHTVTENDQKSLSQNMDLLADINTSYGAAQVMGLYAHNGGMKAKGADGNPINFNVDMLKAAGRRQSPNEQDVQLLLGELGMKGMDMGSKTLSAETMTDKYNGWAAWPVAIFEIGGRGDPIAIP